MFTLYFNYFYAIVLVKYILYYCIVVMFSFSFNYYFDVVLDNHISNCCIVLPFGLEDFHGNFTVQLLNLPKNI